MYVVFQLKSRCEELKLDWGSLCLESLLKEKQALRRQISEKQRHCLELQVHTALLNFLDSFLNLCLPLLLRFFILDFSEIFRWIRVVTYTIKKFCFCENLINCSIYHHGICCCCCMPVILCNSAPWCLFVDQYCGAWEKSKAAGAASAKILQPLWEFPIQKESGVTLLHRHGLF